MVMEGEHKKAPYGSMRKILHRYSDCNITRSQIQKRFQKLKRQDQQELDGGPRRSLFVPSEQTPASLPPVDEIRTSTGTGTSPQSTLTGSSTSTRAKGGRPKGTTNEARLEKEEKMKQALEEASKGLLKIQSTGSGKRRLRKGELQDIMRDAEKAFDLEGNSLDPHASAIRKRAERKNPSGRGESQTSPMELAEPTIVAYCIKCSRISQPLTHDQVRALAISLIDGTEVAKQVINWKKKTFPAQ
jgi:hypothetical protein